MASASSIVGIRLQVEGGEAHAGVLVLADGDDGCPQQLTQLQAAAPALAGLTALLSHASSTGLDAAWRIGTRWLKGRTRWVALAAAAIFGAIAIVPVPDRIKCSCTLEPQVRRFVVAPFAGTLQKALVTPGQVVAQDEPLALLDRRPLEMELTLLKTQEQEAAKRRDAALATRHAAEAQLAELERAGVASQLEHLQHRLEQLTLRSSLAGVIVRGDLQRAEGAPVEMGQSLFEIAPLQPMLAEVAVPEDEVRLVEPGMGVTIRAAAFPGTAFRGVVSRIYPRAEIRDGQSVFIAEVQLPNDDDRLRPGMRGDATVSGRTQPLGWTLVRRPATRMARWIGW